MGDGNNSTPTPRVETLLDGAHHDLAMLRDRRDALIRSGIDSDQLPDELALMAFALLGEHDRSDLVVDLGTDWPELQAKGLVHGAIEAATTAMLRLVKQALPQTAAVDDILQRLENATEAPEVPPGVLRCNGRVRGLWGQKARLYFSAQDALYVRIAPDAVFGLQPALVAAEPSGRCEGSFTFPIDDGAITILLLQRSGEVFRHVVQSATHKVA